ncbi:MAG: DEAD/DEAH box helicase [Bacteroidota bacterium]
MIFKELNLNDQLIDGLDSMGFETATPIQEQGIPIILSGKDLIGCAQTGTGKTAAFLLPILHQLTEQPQESVSTLILVPTRELAMQIDEQLEAFSYFTNISSIPIYGGQGKNAFEFEKKALTQGADIIVATPGRLIAHLNLGYVRFEEVKYFILDEADRMLDMGFVKDIRKINSYLPEKKQTLLFSATMAKEIKKFALSLLHQPEFISLAVSKPAENIIQAVYQVHDDQKLPLLEYVMNPTRTKKGLILIFSSTKAGTKDIARTLQRRGLDVAAMHSDLEQEERKIVLRKFEAGQLPILVATDILSRGIDVDGIRLVINYDMPGDPEDYIHRIGRTARADASGTAISFVTRKDNRRLKAVEKLMEKKVYALALPKDIAEIPEPPKSSRKYGKKSSTKKGGSRKKKGRKR